MWHGEDEASRHHLSAIKVETKVHGTLEFSKPSIAIWFVECCAVPYARPCTYADFSHTAARACTGRAVNGARSHSTLLAWDFLLDGNFTKF